MQRVQGDGSDCRRTASGRTSASEHSDVSREVGHHTFTVGGLRMTNGSPGGQRMHVRRRAWAGETRNCSADGRCHLRCHLRARSMPHLHDAAPPMTLQMHGKCAKSLCGVGNIRSEMLGAFHHRLTTDFGGRSAERSIGFGETFPELCGRPLGSNAQRGAEEWGGDLGRRAEACLTRYVTLKRATGF